MAPLLWAPATPAPCSALALTGPELGLAPQPFCGVTVQIHGCGWRASRSAWSAAELGFTRSHRVPADAPTFSTMGDSCLFPHLSPWLHGLLMGEGYIMPPGTQELDNRPWRPSRVRMGKDMSPGLSAGFL